MKKKIKKLINKVFTSFIIFLTIFALCGVFNLSLVSEVQAADWAITTVDDDMSFVVDQHTSIAIDSNNKVHISYSNYYDLLYATNSSGS